MLSDDGKLGFLVVCFKNEITYLLAHTTMSVEVAVGMASFLGKQEIVNSMKTKLVSGIQI